jgi:signal transduction histidine kinase
MKDKPVILVVDDQPQNIELLEAYLVPQGYEIVKAANGEEALALAAELPDLILLDIMMPKMSGFEVLEKLRADEKTRLIPVVMITALREIEDRVKALEAGCDDFISKPFDKVELLARVKSILKISYYRRQLDEKEKFKAVVDKMSEGIAICSPDWIIQDSNAAVLKYLNIADPANVNLVEIIFQNYSVSIPKEGLMDLTIAHKTFDIVRQESEKAKALYLEANLDAVKNPAGELSSIVFTLRDVTEARREEFLKQDFLGLISHKLRTPLTVITQSASIIQKENICGSLNDKQKKYIESILRQSCLLTNLIDGLLKFTELNTMKLDLQKEEIVLCDYLPLLVNPMIEGIKDKKIELKIDCPDKCYRIRMNKSHLDMIMRNLVENAIKFNNKEVIKIAISVKKSAQELEISIYDNGCGIPAEDQGKIFEKFYQIEKFFTGNVEGAGLGLALVKRLVSAYRGQIELKSEIGKGATFTITLPA